MHKEKNWAEVEQLELNYYKTKPPQFRPARLAPLRLEQCESRSPSACDVVVGSGMLSEAVTPRCPKGLLDCPRQEPCRPAASWFTLLNDNVTSSAFLTYPTAICHRHRQCQRSCTSISANHGRSNSGDDCLICCLLLLGETEAT